MSEGAKPLPPWGSAVAGATGAVLANALVYPLDMYAADGLSWQETLMLEAVLRLDYKSK